MTSAASRCRLVACIGAVMLGMPITVARTQEPRRLVAPDSIPFDLTAALAAAGGFAAEPQILVGAMPEWIANLLYVPSGARVLGSAFLGTTVVAVVTMPVASDSVLPGFRRELSQRGWKAPPPPTNYAGGFRAPPTAIDGSNTRLILCKDDQTLTVTAARRGSAATNVTFRSVGSVAYSVCRPMRMPPQVSRSPLPILVNPPAAIDARTTGECSSLYSGTLTNATNAILRTPLSADSLLVHYGRQLRDSGWTATADKPTIVGQTWTHPDSLGARTEATITVTIPDRDPGCRELNLQIRSVRAP
jgi:hypothetical protein